MPESRVYEYLLSVGAQRGGGFLLLIDPDSTNSEYYLSQAEAAEECGVDAILVGTSFAIDSTFARAVREIKARTSLPVIIFPGSFAQIAPDADAILFSSLLSGRNPNYLIDEQVKGAPLVKRFGIEPIPTAYLLIESGPLTSVQYISGTLPIPRTKTDIARATSLAAQYFGMKFVYLEAGSGAEQPVPVEMVRDVNNYIDIPVIVGGGLRSPKECAERIEAGAAFVVVGNSMEKQMSADRLKEFTDAVHQRNTLEI